METKKCVKVLIKITNNHEIEYLVRNKVAIVIHDENLASSKPAAGTGNMPQNILRDNYT